MPNIQVILGSTRQGRSGEKVARWFMSHAEARADIDVELVDLRDWPLPFFDQQMPPMMGGYSDPEQQRWAEQVARADGYVLVTPEYNHGYPAVLKNALDHLFAEWNGKPVGFVGYGGPGGPAPAQPSAPDPGPAPAPDPVLRDALRRRPGRRGRRHHDPTGEHHD
jgi:NAD(P)H-dependent FMN reductase